MMPRRCANVSSDDRQHLPRTRRGYLAETLKLLSLQGSAPLACYPRATPRRPSRAQTGRCDLRSRCSAAGTRCLDGHTLWSRRSATMEAARSSARDSGGAPSGFDLRPLALGVPSRPEYPPDPPGSAGAEAWRCLYGAEEGVSMLPCRRAAARYAASAPRGTCRAATRPPSAPPRAPPEARKSGGRLVRRLRWG